jgi:Transposase DDE domain
MNSADQLIPIFCQIDDFCKEADQYCSDYFLTGPNNKRKGPEPGLDNSEIMAILVMFQQSRFRDFKNFYNGVVANYWHKYFPRLPSYARFITIMGRVTFLITLFVQVHLGKPTGIYYIDSSCLPVCHLKRSKSHKTFQSVAEYGRTSVGWFFGLKVHLVINHLGELMAFKFTRGSQHDAKAAEPLFNSLNGLAFGDKGYIGKKLFETLMDQGLKLITRKRKNMKKQTLEKHEQQLLNQRGMIETVIGHLKCHLHIWHTRHRSISNAMTHMICALAAYVIQPLQLSAMNQLNG